MSYKVKIFRKIEGKRRQPCGYVFAETIREAKALEEAMSRLNMRDPLSYNAEIGVILPALGWISLSALKFRMDDILETIKIIEEEEHTERIHGKAD